jgi:serine phosphatase RsbU (regulator of sigma subunit)
VYERGQRNVPFSLAAEIQRRLLPDSFTCEAAGFALAGWLEPSSAVGGDTFDYNVEAHALHLSISDARGHTVAAAQLATLAVGALRNSRRVHGSIVDQAEAANDAITAYSSEEDFVSALLLRVDLATGVVTAVNAGHPTPFIARNGTVSAVELEADPPLGMFPGTRYRSQTSRLLPGDRLVLLTDGMLERRAALLDVRSALRDNRASHPREVVRAFAQALLGTTGGALEDDATVLCLDWHGPQP